MKMSERLVLAQWALLLALGVVLVLALRSPSGSKHNPAACRFEVLLSTELDNTSVPVFTKTQLVQPPCMPPWSLRVEANRKATAGESTYVLNVLLQGPEKTTKEENEEFEKPCYHYRDDSETGRDYRVPRPSYSRPLIISPYNEAKHDGKVYDSYNAQYSQRLRKEDEPHLTTFDAASKVTVQPVQGEIQIQHAKEIPFPTTPSLSSPPRTRIQQCEVHTKHKPSQLNETRENENPKQQMEEDTKKKRHASIPKGIGDLPSQKIPIENTLA